ncbi:MAG: hypothetical protein KC431_08930 [Myxococcales bacterium]|nr:hypothetical protein [Myxococcales bacterium]
MANHKLEPNKETSLFPASGDREDSGLQDILAVAAKIKDKSEDGEADPKPGDSGVILFTAGDLGAETKKEEDDDLALFGSFSGGLGAGGLGAGLDLGADSLSSPDLTPLSAEGSVKETRPVEQTAKPAPESSRNPLTAVAVVLGLALVGTGLVFFGKGSDPVGEQPVAASMSAKPDEAAVGKAEEPVEDQVAEPGAEGAAAPEVMGETEGAVGETEGAVGETEGAVGETEGVLGQEGLLADADDPMAQKANLLGSGGGGSKPSSGKWDQGQPAGTGGSGSGGAVDDDPDPDPNPVIDDPDPLPEPKPKSGGGGEASNDEVDCLLNPDLAKCQSGGTKKKVDDEVLAPKIPDKLDSTQLRNGFNTVKSKAKACGSKNGAEAGTKVKVHVSIEGATGKVTSVEATGEHAGTPLGKCVEDVVKDATFDVFKKPAMGIDYSMIM